MLAQRHAPPLRRPAPPLINRPVTFGPGRSGISRVWRDDLRLDGRAARAGQPDRLSATSRTVCSSSRNGARVLGRSAGEESGPVSLPDEPGRQWAETRAVQLFEEVQLQPGEPGAGHHRAQARRAHPQHRHEALVRLKKRTGLLDQRGEKFLLKSVPDVQWVEPRFIWATPLGSLYLSKHDIPPGAPRTLSRIITETQKNPGVRRVFQEVRP